jgi:tetratricopeptide (TPR) repeat protein
MIAMKHLTICAALAASTFLAVAVWPNPGLARGSLRGEDKECADTANAEAAIAACTRLYEDRGVGRNNRAIALGNRGAAYKVTGRYDEAIADFTLAIELDPDNAQYYCQRGDARLRTNANSEAVDDYTVAIRQSPRLLWGYHGRGQAYLAMGNGEAALADLNQAVRLKPDAFSLRVLRGRANNLVKNYEAIVDLNDALDNPKASTLLPKERAAVLTQRAYARAKLDRGEEAQADIDEALRLAPKVAFTVAVAGLVHEKQGRTTEARDAYAQALAIEPNLALAKLGQERIGSGSGPSAASNAADEAEDSAESAQPAEPVVRAKPDPSRGADLCAKYVPEIGRTVKIKCDE